MKLAEKLVAQISELVQTGAVMIVEYRGETTEIIKYTDKKTGAAAQFTKHTMACEFGPDNATKQMACDIDYGKGVDPVPTGYTKGAKILLHLQGLKKSNDAFTAVCTRHQAI